LSKVGILLINASAATLMNWIECNALTAIALSVRHGLFSKKFAIENPAIATSEAERSRGCGVNGLILADGCASTFALAQDSAVVGWAIA
jgi:hypothetical protein